MTPVTAPYRHFYDVTNNGCGELTTGTSQVETADWNADCSAMHGSSAAQTTFASSSLDRPTTGSIELTYDFSIRGLIAQRFSCTNGGMNLPVKNNSLHLFFASVPLMPRSRFTGYSYIYYQDSAFRWLNKMFIALSQVPHNLGIRNIANHSIRVLHCLFSKKLNPNWKNQWSSHTAISSIHTGIQRNEIMIFYMPNMHMYICHET